MTTSTQQLASAIASLINAQSTTVQNINGSTVDTVKRRVINEPLILDGTVTLTKKVPYSNAFIINHPVQGELDNISYQFDIGYDASQEETLAIYKI